MTGTKALTFDVESPSTRKAWIEIKVLPILPLNLECRLPHGRRGLKSYYVKDDYVKIHKSPSTRKAWIEIAQG